MNAFSAIRIDVSASAIASRGNRRASAACLNAEECERFGAQVVEQDRAR